jgi:hypothetical protein
MPKMSEWGNNESAILFLPVQSTEIPLVYGQKRVALPSIAAQIIEESSQGLTGGRHGDEIRTAAIADKRMSLVVAYQDKRAFMLTMIVDPGSVTQYRDLIEIAPQRRSYKEAEVAAR